MSSCLNTVMHKSIRSTSGYMHVHLRRRNDAQGCTVEQVEINDQKFFRALEGEVKAVNRWAALRQQSSQVALRQQLRILTRAGRRGCGGRLPC